MKRLKVDTMKVLRWMILIGGLFVVIACGGNPTPSPVSPYYNGYTGLGTCSTGLSGTPLIQNSDGSPAVATATMGSNTLSLNLYFANSFNATNGSSQSVVAAGSFSFPDMTQIVPTPANASPNYTFCESTVGQMGNQNQGSYDLNTRLLSLVLNSGTNTTTPYFGNTSNPYTTFNVAPAYPTTVALTLGGSQQCMPYAPPYTQLVPPKITGCILVTIMVNNGFSQVPQSFVYNAQ